MGKPGGSCLSEELRKAIGAILEAGFQVESAAFKTLVELSRQDSLKPYQHGSCSESRGAARPPHKGNGCDGGEYWPGEEVCGGSRV